MEHRTLGNSGIQVSVITVGTWAFGGDVWWGRQEDRDSVAVLRSAIEEGVTTVDTAPIYGRGRSERIIGDFIQKNKLRSSIVLATKVGLSWDGPKIIHNLTKQRMLEEVDESRQRLKTDYFDLYQVHWPDPDTDIGETAALMYQLFQKGIIKAVGVSNYSLGQMKEFMNHCPLHSLQPQYSMFERSIEEEIVPFCQSRGIAIVAYAPLYSGILTGKFFFGGVPVPDDLNRRIKRKEFEEPYFSINRDTLEALRVIAQSYGRTLTQLAINWNICQPGISSAIVGTRTFAQLKDNLGSIGWCVSTQDMAKIRAILDARLSRIKALAKNS